MYSHTFICEKKKLAETISKVRAKMLNTKLVVGSEYITVGDEVFTWVSGHFYEFVEPHFYDARYERWNIDDLPIIPKQFQRKPAEPKRAGKVDPVMAKRYKEKIKIIKDLLSKTNIAVNVGDPDREGQLIVDELLIELKWEPFGPKTKRLWAQSLTDSDLIKSFNGMFSNADKKDLFTAAYTRQKADWLHGMNMTRLYSTAAQLSGTNATLTVGRVQTPTVKLVVDRCRAVKNFKPVDYFAPSGFFIHENGKFKANLVIKDTMEGLDEDGRLVDKNVAQKIIASITGKTGKIKSYETKNASKAPPLPFSLTDLQIYCTKNFGITASDTLKYAQSLYDNHKITSYPRTETNHLPSSMYKEQAPSIIEALKNTPNLDVAAKGANLGIKTKAWDDSKLSGHYGLVPTVEFTADKLSKLDTMERKIFEVIAQRFIAQFYPDETWKATTVLVECETYDFRATGRVPVSPGWKAVYQADAANDDDDDPKDKDESSQKLPVMSKGDPVKVEKGDMSAQKTKAPSLFTDASLLEAMKNVAKYETDPELKKRLKESDGIGTVATRAEIIENALRRELLKRDKKYIVSTIKAETLVDILPKEITSAGLTAIWEGQLAKIEKGEASADNFMEKLFETLHKRVANAKNTKITIKGISVEPLPGDGEECQTCHKGLLKTIVIPSGDLKGQRALVCSRNRKDDPNRCTFVKWPQQAREVIKPIAGHGKECPACHKGVLETRKSKTGNFFLACTNWRKDDPTSCKHYEFAETPKITGDGEKCTVCNKGLMKTKTVGSGDNKGKSFLSCTTYPECKNSVFPEAIWGKGKSSSPAKKPTKPTSSARPSKPPVRSASKK